MSISVWITRQEVEFVYSEDTSIDARKQLCGKFCDSIRGTKMAPAYANLFMGKLEQKLIHIGKQHIQIWKRFIDDIFIICHEQFSEYMNTINKLHDTIKFTHDISDTEFTFLDVTLYKGNRFQSHNILDIRTHIKPTNKPLYVHASSYHPPSILAVIY